MKSKSIFITLENSNVITKDEKNLPANGTRFFINPKDNKKYIVRFRNGFLDGDSYNKDGKLIVQPAIEGEGHLEYWRKGRLHRDGGLAAVSTNGFTENEYWENGIKQESFNFNEKTN